jgi:DNA-directed RNA polymerase specialized sigma24 family protein
MGMSLRESVLRAQKLPRDDAIIRSRAQLLSEDDRDLIEAVMLVGQSTESLARLMGQKPRTLRDRVNRLVRRMAGDNFLHAARALPYLSPADAEVARLRFCAGYRLRQLCERYSMSEHTIRRWVDSVHTQVKMIDRLSRQPADGAAQAYRNYWEGEGASVSSGR